MATAITNLSISAENTTQGTLSDNNSTGQTLNNYGVFVAGYKVAYTGTKTTIVMTPSSIVESSSPSDNTWTFPITSDGWFNFSYVAAPFWNVTTSYSQYDLAYDEVTDSIYQASSATVGGSTPSSNSNFTLVSDIPALIDDVGNADEPGNMIYQDFDILIYPNLKKKFGDAASKAALEACSDCERSTDVESYEFLKVLLDGIQVANNRSEYIKGEKIARRAEQL